jgi:hypothetical protein
MSSSTTNAATKLFPAPPFSKLSRPFQDISKQLVDLDRHPIVRIRFSKGFVFACLQAANEFEEQRSRFFDESNLLDDYMEVRSLALPQ